MTALGFFDGVHAGHAALLRRAVDVARRDGLEPCVITFDVHPGALVHGQPQPLLNTPSERAALIRAKGIGETLALTFDRCMMRMPWQEFIGYIKGLGAARFVVGHDFRFGYRGEGDAERLAALCGAACDIIPEVKIDGITVSSTYIRGLVASGDMERAALFLGRPHFISGTVAHGRGIGTGLGAPTINIPIPEGIQPPAYGVYFTRVHPGMPEGGGMPAVTNVGVRPTFGDAGAGVTVESTILDFSGGLYGKPVCVEFLRHIRPERRFEDAARLREQIGRDIAAARDFFG